MSLRCHLGIHHWSTWLDCGFFWKRSCLRCGKLGFRSQVEHIA